MASGGVRSAGRREVSALSITNIPEVLGIQKAGGTDTKLRSWRGGFGGKSQRTGTF